MTIGSSASPSPSTSPLTAAGAAEGLTALARRFGAAFVAFDAAAGAAAVPARRIALAHASRLLGAHAQALAALVPESVLLAGARAAGEATPVDLPPTPEAIVDDLARALDALAAQATPVADAAVRRVAAAVSADLASVAAALAAAR